MPEVTARHQIIRIHLSGWRYFAALTLPPLGLIFKLLFSIESTVLMLLFFITHYYCWRLWLDERLFRLIDSEEDLPVFDKTMAHFRIKKTVNSRSLAERWDGVRNLFYRAIFSLMTLWLASLCSILYRFFTLPEQAEKLLQLTSIIQPG